MSVEASLKEMSENISQIIGIVEDVKEIKIKLNNIERDISGYREEMIEMRTNLHNFQDRFDEHRASQIVDFDKMGASCREITDKVCARVEANYKELSELNSKTKRNVFDSIDMAKKEAVTDAVKEVKLWLYGAIAMAFVSLLIPAIKELLRQ